MRKIVKEELPVVMDYLRRDIPNCIYMYVDIGTYGLDNPNLELWIDGEPGDIRLVFMQYYNSLQLFSAEDDFDVGSAAAFISERRYPVINGRIATLRLLETALPEYVVHDGLVFRCDNYMHKEIPFLIEEAREDEFQEIAELICGEPTFAHYEVNSLREQLLERLHTGMGRNRVVHVDGRIIGHIATFAEYETIAVTSGLVVNHNYTAYAYGSIMESELFRELLEEGKTVYTFITERKRAAFLRALGCKQVADYGKMLLEG